MSVPAHVRRRRRRAVIAAMGVLLTCAVLYGVSEAFWLGVTGPTDSAHRQFRAELMCGWLCVGRRLGPSMGEQPRQQLNWRIYGWRNYNGLAYEENWGGIRSDLAWSARIPLVAPLGAAALGVVWAAWPLVRRRGSMRGAGATAPRARAVNNLPD